MFLLKYVLNCEQHFSFNPDYLTTGVTVTGLARVYCNFKFRVGVEPALLSVNVQVNIRVTVTRSMPPPSWEVSEPITDIISCLNISHEIPSVTVSDSVNVTLQMGKTQWNSSGRHEYDRMSPFQSGQSRISAFNHLSTLIAKLGSVTESRVHTNPLFKQWQCQI
jgi:hypothetical protein